MVCLKCDQILTILRKNEIKKIIIKKKYFKEGKSIKLFQDITFQKHWLGQ